ncbi:MAG: glycerol-3-phosphate 1-O-acyltransferase PlsY [Pseudolabrys sp.]|nr:glycerol-3-phosphate 1-O-acyltransferase PlsY [Pseudolabrys sp.]MBV9261037.1 glycerol-3-phosphate 1-O-acyltransferase PlsY [Pseudolabrys sp.]
MELNYAIALVFGYLLGSIPFGLVLTRLSGGPDLRSLGSGNIGATNVLRTGKKGLAAATLMGDMLKGTAAVYFAGFVFGHGGALLAGLGAFLGHLFPVWLGFKGGKGVATYIGVLLGLAWPFVPLFGVVWLAVAYFTRYSSLSALVASAVTPVALAVAGQGETALLFLLLTAMLWFMHRPNIQRLITGTEGKIGEKSPPAAP